MPAALCCSAAVVMCVRCVTGSTGLALCWHLQVQCAAPQHGGALEVWMLAAAAMHAACVGMRMQRGQGRSLASGWFGIHQSWASQMPAMPLPWVHACCVVRLVACFACNAHHDCCAPVRTPLSTLPALFAPLACAAATSPTASLTQPACHGCACLCRQLQPNCNRNVGRAGSTPLSWTRPARSAWPAATRARCSSVSARWMPAAGCRWHTRGGVGERVQRQLAPEC